jgi:hypothetical protein
MLNKTTHPLPNAPDTLATEEIRSAIAAMVTLIPRLGTVMSIDEAGALLVVLKLAREASMHRALTLSAVAGVVGDYVGRNGVLSLPRREIARRLAVSPEDVDVAVETLIADGYLVELRPRRFLRPQRRFWLRRPPPPS